MNSSSGSFVRIDFNYADLMFDFTVGNLVGDFTRPLSSLLAQPFEKPLRIFQVTIENSLVIYLSFESSLDEKQDGLLTLAVESYFLHPNQTNSLFVPLSYRPAANLHLNSGVLTLFEKGTGHLKEEREPSVDVDPQGYVPINKSYIRFEDQDVEYHKYLVRSTYLNIMTLLLHLKKGYMSYNPLVSFNQLTEISSRVQSFWVYYFNCPGVPIVYDVRYEGVVEYITYAKHFRLLVKDPGPTGLALVQCIIMFRTEKHPNDTSLNRIDNFICVFCQQSTKLFAKDDAATRSMLNPLMGPFHSENYVGNMYLHYHSCKDPSTYRIRAPLGEYAASPTYEEMYRSPAQEPSAMTETEEQGSYLPEILARSKDFIGLLLSLSDLSKIPKLWLWDHTTFPDCEDLPLIYLRLADGRPSAFYRFGFNHYRDPEAEQLANSVAQAVRSSPTLRKLASLVVPNSRRARRGFCRSFKEELNLVLSPESQSLYEEKMPLERNANMEMIQRFISNWAVDLP